MSWWDGLSAETFGALGVLPIGAAGGARKVGIGLVGIVGCDFVGWALCLCQLFQHLASTAGHVILNFSGFLHFSKL